jgi:hypothetical protein
MTKKDEHKLGPFLREVGNWDWEEFCRAENDPSYTSNEAIIFALIRACAMEKMEAIKLALNRIDGKLKTPIRIEMPKVFYLFPRALPPEEVMDTEIEKHNAREKNLKHLPGGTEVVKGDMQYEAIDSEPEEKEPEDNDLPSLSLRQTLAKMADAPREVPQFVMEFATLTQQWLNHQVEEPDEKPLVKSVVAAHLLKLAQERNVDALSEVFDQIDGKLVETIQILGEDIFITTYSLNAPDGAYLNSDGVLQLEATQAQNMWAEKLGKQNVG